MKYELKAAFDAIHAGEDLRENAKEFLHKKLYAKKRSLRRPALAMACLALLLLVCAGYFSYYTPVAAVSVDINPSLELDVNLYDRVIRITGYNEEGEGLAETLSVLHMNYSDAINAILESDPVVSYLQKDELLEVTVSGNDEKSEAISHCISSQTAVEAENVHCCKSSEDAAKAHAAGFSLGKYRAFLELQKLDPSVEVESVRGLTMRQIRDRIAQAASSESESSQPSSLPEEEASAAPEDISSSAPDPSSSAEHCGNGQGNGMGNGQGNGQHGQGHGQGNGQGNGQGHHGQGGGYGGGEKCR